MKTRWRWRKKGKKRKGRMMKEMGGRIVPWCRRSAAIVSATQVGVGKEKGKGTKRNWNEHYGMIDINQPT